MAKPAAMLPILLFLLSTSSLALSYETQETKESRDNPYYFPEESFSTPLSTQEGKLRILQRFSERSHLLRRIENYRIALLEANPNTALIPNHFDADTLVFVVEGSATITLLRKENRESYNLRRGDLLRVRAGSTAYIINNDNKEKLYIVNLFETISVPGQLQAFFGIGGQNPESYYMSFSSHILEAAFNTEYDKVRRVFGQHQEGSFVRVSEEKIRELARQASSSQGGQSHYEGRSRGPFNLYEQRPTYSNQHGRLQEVDANDYPALRDQDIAVSYANIRGGSMEAPYYNSRATKVAVVLDGSGYFEMTCPHLAGRRSREEGEQGRQGEESEPGRREGEEESVSYQKVSAKLSPGDVYVVPAGHPFVNVADKDQELRIVCFEINAEDNKKYMLAGQDNIFNKLNREEREIFFKESEREVQQVLNAQREAGLLEGPEGRKERGGEGRSDV
ncbi:vicilin-like protein antimicrobial peptides 2-2 precursor [Cinnamomum micranthum f. kanehirae]|uniref:Vicilin-like protein antimicrobial peptides 2-2 n=1 Tax=Cinnamomum micranthum f. kanehirae TaxID=337451 RepID=A0A3S3N4I3_9MAGN|nr:vicilin-like protein antimicrobial peptides 2-2 precursor [Cinnamomum micranthum f. kanehirae]